MVYGSASLAFVEVCYKHCQTFRVVPRGGLLIVFPQALVQTPQFAIFVAEPYSYDLAGVATAKPYLKISLYNFSRAALLALFTFCISTFILASFSFRLAISLGQVRPGSISRRKREFTM